MSQATIEKPVRLAAKLYEMRDTAKRLMRDKYAERIAEFGKVVTAVANKEGIDLLAAATAICKHEGVSPMEVLMVMAATVELLEPSA